MADAFRCDRCGKYEDGTPNACRAESTEPGYAGPTPVATGELCTECAEEFEAYAAVLLGQVDKYIEAIESLLDEETIRELADRQLESDPHPGGYEDGDVKFSFHRNTSEPRFVCYAEYEGDEDEYSASVTTSYFTHYRDRELRVKREYRVDEMIVDTMWDTYPLSDDHERMAGSDKPIHRFATESARERAENDIEWAFSHANTEDRISQ